jgi:hypothetical protein
VVVAAIATLIAVLPPPQQSRQTTTNQIDCKRRQAIVPAPGPAVFDGYIPPFVKTGLVQALVEGAQTVCVQLGRTAGEKPDHRQRVLVRPRRDRPSRGSAAD